MCLAEENPAAEFNIQKPENSMFTFCDDSIGSYDCSSVNSTPENLTDLDDPESEGSFLGNENEAPLSSTPRIKIYGSNNYHNFIMHSLHMSPILPHDATIISKTACDGNWTQEENTLNGTDDILADTIIEVTDYYSFFSVSSPTPFTSNNSLGSSASNMPSSSVLSFKLPSSNVTFELDWEQLSAKRRCVRKLF